MKRTLVIVLLFSVFMMSACDQKINNTEQAKTDTSVLQESQTNKTEKKSEESSESTEHAESAEHIESAEKAEQAEKAEHAESSGSTAGITFEELATLNYSFSSGVGGWSDSFNIEPDGTFHGVFQDSEMGDVGEGYPMGSAYLCEYEGRFADIQKIDDYTYSMQMTEITVTGPNEEYIENDIRYVPAEPYALENAEEIQIYLPGKPVSEISEDILFWLFIPSQQQTLDSLSLVNVNMMQGICSYE